MICSSLLIPASTELTDFFCIFSVAKNSRHPLSAPVSAGARGYRPLTPIPAATALPHSTRLLLLLYPQYFQTPSSVVEITKLYTTILVYQPDSQRWNRTNSIKFNINLIGCVDRTSNIMNFVTAANKLIEKIYLTQTHATRKPIHCWHCCGSEAPQGGAVLFMNNYVKGPSQYEVTITLAKILMAYSLCVAE